jgi:hypothetical protein
VGIEERRILGSDYDVSLIQPIERSACRHAMKSRDQRLAAPAGFGTEAIPRVVTAPTNGAAGIIPAALRQFCHEWPQAREQARRFLLTVGGIGLLYKQRASISSAEMSCQGEVGVACSMEAAGLAAVWGGTPDEGQLSTHLRPSAGLVRGSGTCLAASTESFLKGDILKPTPLRT